MLKRYGKQILSHISGYLIEKGVGMEDLLGAIANDAEVREVTTFFLDYYTNLRGKDYSRKQNSQTTASTETHRATIGVASQLAKKRAEAAKKNKADMDNSATYEDNNEEEVTDFDGLRLLQLKSLCKEQFNACVNTQDHSNTMTERTTRSDTTTVRIKTPDQVQTGGALSVEHGYNIGFTNGDDLL